MLANPLRLQALGVLGINERNSVYIGRHNPRKLFPLVDNKLQTKTLLQQHTIRVPSLIAALKHQHQVAKLHTFLPPCSGFAIKPAKGSGGKGILVISASQDAVYTKSNGATLGLEALKRHCSNILAGLYSLGGQADAVIIEQLISFDPNFDHFSYEGVPDVRVIVFKGYPTMCMMRLATKASDGKANLHQGAVGVGIDIATGKATHAVMQDKPIAAHPDTQQSLKQLSIPNWRELLTLSARCYECSGLGYLGVDIVLDEHHGPMVLELNARPGLAIQIANQQGLKPRLTAIENQRQRRSAEERVAFSINQFATPSLTP